MGKLLLSIIILILGSNALVRPWMGVASYYLLAILGPQYIWWWIFEGVRVSFLVAISTMAGVAFQVIRKNYNFVFLLNRQSFWLLLLWICIANSFFFGPYVKLYSSSGLRPEQLFAITNTIFIFYFFAAVEINKIHKLRYLFIVFAVSTMYLTYWANNQYFTQNWSQFSMGRLMGPRSIDGGSIYRDENAFALLFVTGVPFIFCLGLEAKRRWVKILLWGVIPLSAHAIFLTGSRGGLLGLGIIATYAMFASKKKLTAALLIMMFVSFYQWQAGDVMKSRSDTITNYEGEGSAEGRIAAWKGGLNMIAEHPVSGVGLGSFITALPRFYDTSPRVAHNTFIQFTAESGLGAGVAYLMLIIGFFRNSRNISVWCSQHPLRVETLQIGRFNYASTASFCGLIVCSMFLSLNTYEIIFFLLIVNNALLHICDDLSGQGNTEVPKELGPLAKL